MYVVAQAAALYSPAPLPAIAGTAISVIVGWAFDRAWDDVILAPVVGQDDWVANLCGRHARVQCESIRDDRPLLSLPGQSIGRLG